MAYEIRYKSALLVTGFSAYLRKLLLDNISGSYMVRMAH